MKSLVAAIVLLSAYIPAQADPFYTALVAGTDAYNAEDTLRCVEIYTAVLEQALPALPPDLKAKVTDALARAPGEPTDQDKAFLLRRVIDETRAELKKLAASPCSCGDPSKCTCAACAARRAKAADGIKGDEQRNPVPVSAAAPAPPPPPVIALPPALTVRTSVCSCQQGGSCRCMAQTGTCHCTPSSPHVYHDAVNRYRWSLHADFAALKDVATGEQVGAYVFDAKPPFTPMKDGQWGQPCDLPEGVKPPTAPARQVSVAAPVRTVQMCAGST